MNEEGTNALHLHADERNRSKNSALKPPPQGSKIPRRLKPCSRIPGPTDSGPAKVNEKTTPKRRCISESQISGTTAKKPLLICWLIAEYPKTFLAVNLGIHLTFVALSIILVLSGYDLFPINFKTLPMELRDEPWLKRYIAFSFRENYENRVRISDYRNPTLPRFTSIRGLTLIYYAEGKNIFTKENLRIIKTIEDRLYNLPDFMNIYCQLTPDLVCVRPYSILRFFDGTFAHVSPVFYDPEFDNVTAVIFAAFTTEKTRKLLFEGLGKEHIITSKLVQSEVTKSYLPLGWPIDGEWNVDKGLELEVEFMHTTLKPIVEEYQQTVRGFEVLYYSGSLEIHEAFKQAMKDMLLAIASLCFIFFYLLFHTRTLWVTSLGIFSIMCSFIEANLIYRIVLDFRYFGLFHVIALFIILGVGVDDFFVFWDSWLDSGHYRFPSLAHRLSEAYQKSAQSMFVTSFSTMIAFAANSTSPLLATYSFGIFATILIIIDYLSVITFFVSIVVVYHVSFEGKSYSFAFWRCHAGSPEVQTTVQDDSLVRDTCKPNAEFSVNPCTLCNTLPGKSRSESILVQDKKRLRRSLSMPKMATELEIQGLGVGDWKGSFDSANKGEERPPRDVASRLIITAQEEVEEAHPDEVTQPGSSRRLVAFFSKQYFWFVTHPVFRWVLVAFFLTIILFLSISAGRLDLDSKQVKFFRDNNNYAKASRLLFFGFVPTDSDIRLSIFLLWGVKEHDLSSCHFSEEGCLGTGGYDNKFDASTPASQKAFADLCKTLMELPQQTVDKMAILRNFTSKELQISCFATEMEQFLRRDNTTSNLDVSLPWDWNKTRDFMAQHNDFYNVSAFDETFTNYLDIPLTYWLWNGFTGNNSAALNKFSPLIGEEFAFSSRRVLGINRTIYVGNKIKYVGVSVKTTLVFETLGYTKHLSVLEEWERFMQDQLSKMPPELQTGFQLSFAWHWLKVQKALVDNAVFGILLGVLLALPVLVLATCNIINGVLATLIIAAITVCVIGVIPLMGWSMGVLVSLNMCLVVGLSVDYVVHLAEGYHMSLARDRLGRLQDALRSMGLPVFSGACTTLGASFFTFFAQIQFFYQFGVFMFCTIGFSLLFSMGLFTTLMGIIGPEGDTADVRAMARRLFCSVPTNKKEKLPSKLMMTKST